MGLGTSHDCWHGPYSAFNAWRKEICEAAGLGDLYDYYGFGGDKIFDKDDPLTILLYHSDCDGEIEWKDSNAIANRLEECLPNVFGYGSDDIDNHYYVDKTTRFIKGLHESFECQENVEFH